MIARNRKNYCIGIAKNGYDVAITFCSNEVESRKTVSELKNLGSVSKAFKIDFTETRNIEPFFLSLTSLIII